MGAVFSPCRTWRYALTRGEGALLVAWFLVNPSTAAEDEDDQTSKKTTGFTARWFGPTRHVIMNKFALVSTDVKALATAPDPIGPDNDRHIARVFDEAAVVIFGWGSLAKLPPALRWRWLDVYRMAIMKGHTPLCFGVNADGHPTHPQMTGYDQPPMIWDRPNG